MVNITRQGRSLFCTALLLFSSLLLCNSVYALGLRTFVALPVAKNDLILRGQNFFNNQNHSNVITGNLAYGFTDKLALFVGVPYVSKLPGRSTSRIINFSAMFRLTVFQHDTKYTTFRIGVLAGGLVPVATVSHGAARGGVVATYFRGRSEFDADVIYAKGVGKSHRRDNMRYDFSWQYRIYPKDFNEWDLGYSINTVLEYNGRWFERNNTIHQVTGGLQLVYPRWVLEGGVVKDVSDPHATGFIVSVRLHV